MWMPPFGNKPRRAPLAPRDSPDRVSRKILHFVMDSKEPSGILDAAMKVVRIADSGGGPILVPGEGPKPQPGRGEVLIEVAAAGGMLTEIAWYPTTHTETGQSRAGAVPGHEFSGVVAGVTRQVNRTPSLVPGGNCRGFLRVRREIRGEGHDGLPCYRYS
jgi:hypothetical protein